MFTPVENAPVFSPMEILDNTSQSHVVFTTGSLSEASQKSNCKANFKATDNVSINQVTKDLMVTKANIAL
jgi:hypothetical protein